MSSVYQSPLNRDLFKQKIKKNIRKMNNQTVDIDNNNQFLAVSGAINS